MTGYDVAIWRWREDGWPQVVTTQEAKTAAGAVLRVMQAHGLRSAAKVAAAAHDGFIWRWYHVACDAEGFYYRSGGRSRLGMPVPVG